MKAIYWQRGETLDYTPTEDVEAGSVVPLVTRIGIAAAGIAANRQGTLQMEGVFELAKTGTAAVEMGQALYFDGTGITDVADNGKTDSTKVSYIPAGYAAAPAAAADTTVLVKLLG